MGTGKAQDNRKNNGSQRGTKHNITARFGKGKLNAKQIEFCTKRAFGDTVRGAALVLGMPFGTALDWNAREDIRAYTDKIVEQIGKETLKRELKARLLQEAFLDEEVVTRLKRTKKTTFVTNNLIEIGYKGLGLIQSGRVQVNATAGAQSAAIAPGAMAYELYEPMWLRQKKAEWDQQLEQKYGNELLSDGGSSSGPDASLAAQPAPPKL